MVQDLPLPRSAAPADLRGNLLVAHGGGPTAVINSSLYGVIQEASGLEAIDGVYGARFGTAGLLSGDWIDLRRQPQEQVEALKHTPASALGSSRRTIEDGDYECILDHFRRQDVRFFLFNGGNGTMLAAAELARRAVAQGYELRVIGIPKTVDNDLAGTDHAPGYGSAARYMAVTALELGRDNQALPFPVCIFEAMGRNTGWLAAASTLFARHADDGPQLVYVPEIPFHREQFLADVEATYRRTGRAFIVVSEGIRDEQGELFVTSLATDRDGFGRPLPGNVSVHLAGLVGKELRLRVRNEKPGLCARTSMAHVSATDRAEAEECGRYAVRAAVAGNSGMMVSLRRASYDSDSSHTSYCCEYALTPLDDVAGREQRLPVEWFNAEARQPGRAFYDYALPLTGDDIPRHARFN